MINQHAYLPQPCGPDRHAYRTAMCGLCHALGDGYSLPARLLTGHDAILLNLIASAQRAEAPDVVMRRCPLNPLMKVTTNKDSSAAFAAAASVALTYASADDHVQDSGGRDLPARALRGALTTYNRTAMDTLAALGFDPATIAELGARQTAAESDPSADAAQPTAFTSARLFAMTASLAGQPLNADPLSRIGAAYGAYIYLADAYRDLSRDLARGDFNPLRRYAESGTLSEQGKTWLIARMERILASLREQLPRVVFHRDSDLVRRMLMEPVEKHIAALEGRQISRRACSHRHAHAAASAAGTPFPIVRVQVNPGGGDSFDPSQMPPPQPGQRRRRRENPYDDGNDCTDCCNPCECSRSCNWCSCPCVPDQCWCGCCCDDCCCCCN